MPDITMCQNSSCPVRGQCYRYTATPGTRQSYSCFVPGGPDCGYFYLNLGFRSQREVREVDTEMERLRQQGAILP